MESCRSKTSLLRSNGEGDRSAARLSGGGASATFAQAIDSVCNCLRISKHVTGWSPNDLESERVDVIVPSLVGVLTLVVRGPVDLDNQLRSRAIEIGYIRADRMLFAEAELSPAEAQQPPEQHFGEAELPPEAFCRAHRLASCSHGVGPSTTQLR